ncbi:MAG: hypothetical protein KDD03_13185 [Gelidibacter sp.]|nr:hypothetical protein [Gelidibacter sp.]
MKTKIGYKVVTYDMMSYIISKELSEDRKFSITYVLNEWVKPKSKYAPLMVFADKTSVENFLTANNSGSGYVYKCEYVQSKRKWGWCFGYINQQISLRKNKKRAVSFGGLPRGTILADAVKLVEKV